MMIHSVFQKNNVAVVTGAALGIGQSMSKHFASMGMHVLMVDIDEEALNTAANFVGSKAQMLVADVANDEDWLKIKEGVLRHWDTVPTVLVNNAVTRIGRGFDVDISEWRSAIDTNIMGIVLGVNTFREEMEKSDSPGLIINVGSKQGITNPPGHPVYNFCKAAIKSYTESLQHDLRQNPAARVNAHLLVPGWTTTGNNEHKQGAWLPEQVVEYMMEAIEKGSFYIICPDDETSEELDKQRILQAAEDIINDRVPLSRWFKA